MAVPVAQRTVRSVTPSERRGPLQHAHKNCVLDNNFRAVLHVYGFLVAKNGLDFNVAAYARSLRDTRDRWRRLTTDIWDGLSRAYFRATPLTLQTVQDISAQVADLLCCDELDLRKRTPVPPEQRASGTD